MRMRMQLQTLACTSASQAESRCPRSRTMTAHSTIAPVAARMIVLLLAAAPANKLFAKAHGKPASYARWTAHFVYRQNHFASKYV